MYNFRLLQLIGDLVSVGYSLERPSMFGMREQFQVDYLVVCDRIGLPVGRIFQAGHRHAINYEPFPYDDIEGRYYSEQAHIIVRSRQRLLF